MIKNLSSVIAQSIQESLPLKSPDDVTKIIKVDGWVGGKAHRWGCEGVALDCIHLILFLVLTYNSYYKSAFTAVPSPQFIPASL